MATSRLREADIGSPPMRLGSVKLHQESSWAGRWRSPFQIAFSEWHVPPDPGIDAMVLGTFEDGEPVDPCRSKATVTSIG